MGYALTHPEFLGLYGAREEDLEAFVHFWRVIGSLLGIEDRYLIIHQTQPVDI